MAILTVAFAAVAAILMLPALSDAISLARASRRRREMPDWPDRPRLLFLVPAHQEEALIGDCVRSLVAQRYPHDCLTIVVIADNCSDRTAARARESGAVCLERNDTRSPGKPRAIAWALTELRLEQLDAVIVIDADTVVDPGFAAALGQYAPLNGQVLQAYFDVANPDDSALTTMAAVLAAANFRFAYRLKRRGGVNAPLLGNGMCIGTGVLMAHGWNAFTIAEDWELYARYTARGISITSVDAARLFAQEARSLGQSTTQRQRWTAGKLTVLVRHLGGVMRSTKIGFHQKLDAAAELAAPGPVVHLGIVTVACLVIALLGVPGGAWLAVALCVPLVRLAIYAAIALLAQPDPLRAAASFVFLPIYAGWRLVTAVMSLKMVGDKPWVRTARH